MIENVVRYWDEVFRLIKHQMVKAAYEKVKQAQQQLRQETAIARRQQIDELNQSILVLNISIIKIVQQQSEIHTMCPDFLMTEINHFLIELKQRKGELEAQKREIARARL